MTLRQGVCAHVEDFTLDMKSFPELWAVTRGPSSRNYWALFPVACHGETTLTFIGLSSFLLVKYRNARTCKRIADDGWSIGRTRLGYGFFGRLYDGIVGFSMDRDIT
jgi:hypothetical protein